MPERHKVKLVLSEGSYGCVGSGEPRRDTIMSARKTPILLRKAPLSSRINVLTNYRRAGKAIRATIDGKHDVTADFDALVCELLLDPDSPDIIGILDGVGDGALLTGAEKQQVRSFRFRLKNLVERHNTTGHGAA